MGVLDELGKAGLSFSGSPPSTQVALGDAVVTVSAEESTGKLILGAQLPARNGAPADLSGPALAAEGDTSFSASGDSVVARRTLVEPSAGAAYDAVFELAKSAASLVRLFDDMARLAGTGDLPTGSTAAAAVTETMATPVAAQVPAPVPSAAQAWSPTHAVPAGGMRTWPQPHPNAPEGPSLDASLPVQVAERKGDWARVVASNGWSGWVDGRLLP